MQKRSDEESTGRLEWLEKNVNIQINRTTPGLIRQHNTARVKGKVYKVAVKPAMLYGLETVALTKRQQAEMEATELKLLRFSLGVTSIT